MTHNNRGRLAVDIGGAWRLYWSGPTPYDLHAIGTVTRSDGETGALFESLRGAGYWQGNVRALKRVDQDKVRAAIEAARPRRGGARPGCGVKPADGAQGVIRKNVTLDQPSIDALRALGDGDLSLGIRRAAAKL